MPEKREPGMEGSFMGIILRLTLTKTIWQILHGCRQAQTKPCKGGCE